MQLNDVLDKWVCFGPIMNPGGYPGQLAWSSLPGDGLASVPSRLIVEGQTYMPMYIALGDDTSRIDFRKVFGGAFSGSPQCYAFCEFTLPRKLPMILSVDVDWGAIVWLDGREIFDIREGNHAANSFFQRITLTIPQGRHVLACRVISGCAGWNLSLRAITKTEEQIARVPYSECGLRVEQRPLPGKPIYGMSPERFETLAAGCGVESRWVSVVDQSKVELSGSALYKSAVFPPSETYEEDFDQKLVEWIKRIHDLGMTVISWYPMCYNHQGWLDYPEWRQKYLIEPDSESVHARTTACCINSPYGQAVAEFCIESIRKFDLDAIYFDGSAFTPIWEPYQPVSCICDYCNAKYTRETGGEAPKVFNPETLEFRRWIAWRYRNFAEYWRVLADTIRKACPHTELVVNHYHREKIGWNAAVPLNPFPADIISGSEADGDPWKSGFHTRILRAYGRPRTEIWMNGQVGLYQLNGQKRNDPYSLMTLALACLTAGGDSSTGDVDYTVSASTMVQMAAEINARKPFRNLSSLPLAALHVSHLTDTYTFGVNPAFITRQWKDLYWNSLLGWDWLLMHAGVWTDVVFDDHLQKSVLEKYRYLFTPFAVALTEPQIQTLLDYVRNGGTLITGPWFATQDEWGFARTRSRQMETLFPHGDYFPEFSQLATLLDTLGQGKNICIQRLEKGTIIQLPMDLGGNFRTQPSLEMVKMVRDLLGRDRGNIPLCLEGPDGKNVFAHMGVFADHDGNWVVSIQQLIPFWTARDIMAETPPVAAHWRLKVTWPDVRRAQCCIPAPGFDLDVVVTKASKEIVLPPFTWGTVIKLFRQE